MKQLLADLTRFIAEEVAKSYTDGFEAGSGISGVDDLIKKAVSQQRLSLIEEIRSGVEKLQETRYVMGGELDYWVIKKDDVLALLDKLEEEK